MFTKKNEKVLTEVSTIIGEHTEVIGSLNVESSIRIDGQVNGEIKCSGDVTIGKDGQVENTLTARNLYIAGVVKGNVYVESKIHIYETGILDGNAEMATLVIDEKGSFHGQSNMKGVDSPQEEEEIADEISNEEEEQQEEEEEEKIG